MWEASQCWEESQHPSHPPAHLLQRLIAAPSVQGEMLCVLKLMGQKEKNIFSCGPDRGWRKSEKSPLFHLLPARDKSIIRKGDNTGFSLGKRKVSRKAKLLSLLWRLHGTLLLGCGLSPPIETCLFQSSVGFWEVL